MRLIPPHNIDTLLLRAKKLAGRTIGEIAKQFSTYIPSSLHRNKGWVGLMLEHALGANGGNQLQDFPKLGVELKTIPINQYGKPLETTFICRAPLYYRKQIDWDNSEIKKKLSKVLWIPIQVSANATIADRIVGTPLLWIPNKVELLQLQIDWEELTDLLVLGQVQKISAHYGEVLQLRPKAANNRSITEASGEDGIPIKSLPLGFYLKSAFTQNILATHFICPSS